MVSADCAMASVSDVTIYAYFHLPLVSQIMNVVNSVRSHDVTMSYDHSRANKKQKKKTF